MSQVKPSIVGETFLSTKWGRRRHCGRRCCWPCMHFRSLRCGCLHSCCCHRNVTTTGFFSNYIQTMKVRCFCLTLSGVYAVGGSVFLLVLTVCKSRLLPECETHFRLDPPPSTTERDYLCSILNQSSLLVKKVMLVSVFFTEP